MGFEPVTRFDDVIPYMPFLRIDDDAFEFAERHVTLADDHDIVEGPDRGFYFGGVEVT